MFKINSFLEGQGLFVVAAGVFGLVYAVYLYRIRAARRVKPPLVDALPKQVRHLLPESLDHDATAAQIARAILHRAGSGHHLSLPPAIVAELQACPEKESYPAALKAALTISGALADITKSRGEAFEEARDEGLLKDLWATIPAEHAPTAYQRFSKHWDVLGFQGEDPTTDLRAGGVYALRQYLSFAQKAPNNHHRMIAYNKNALLMGEPSWFNEGVVSIQMSVQLTLQWPEPAAVQRRGLLGRREASPATSNDSVPVTDAMIDYVYQSTGDTAQRIDRLHRAHLVAFFRLWSRDKPFIMEYNTYMKKTFYTEGAALIDKALISGDSDPEL